MLKDQLENSALVQAVLNRYDALPPRDQAALKLLATFFAVVLAYLLMLAPATEYSQQAQARYKGNVDTLQWMESNRAAVANRPGAQQAADQSLLGIANSTAKRSQLDFTRYEPVGDNGLSLWLEEVPFNNVVVWLEMISQQYGISVQEITVNKHEENGVANVRLILQGRL